MFLALPFQSHSSQYLISHAPRTLQYKVTRQENLNYSTLLCLWFKLSKIDTQLAIKRLSVNRSQHTTSHKYETQDIAPRLYSLHHILSVISSAEELWDKGNQPQETSRVFLIPDTLEQLLRKNRTKISFLISL